MVVAKDSVNTVVVKEIISTEKDMMSLVRYH